MKIETRAVITCNKRNKMLNNVSLEKKVERQKNFYYDR